MTGAAETVKSPPTTRRSTRRNPVVEEPPPAPPDTQESEVNKNEGRRTRRGATPRVEQCDVTPVNKQKTPAKSPARAATATPKKDATKELKTPEKAEKRSEPKREASPVPAALKKLGVVKVEEADNQRSRRAHVEYDFPEDGTGLFRCPVPDCNWEGESRAVANFHMRKDHPGYKEGQPIPEKKSERKKGPIEVQPHTITPSKKRGRPSNLEKYGNVLANAKLEKEKKPDIIEPPPQPTVTVTVEAVERKPHMPVLSQPKDDPQGVMHDLPPLDLEEYDYEELEEEDSDSNPDVEFNAEEMEMKKLSLKRVPLDEHGVPIKRGRGRPRKTQAEREMSPGPRSKLRVGVPDGRYACYVSGCNWRGNYRSIRSAHMRAIHRDWVPPPRYVLNRMGRGGLITDEVLIPKYPCFIPDCPWKGNYRASRSMHMRHKHPEWNPPRRRSAPGGYCPDGQYTCHVEGCEWRGTSRSTRSQHIRKFHADFINTNYATRSVPCSDCPMSLMSHKLFVDHMVSQHHVGGIVQREFNDEWFDAVQDSFQIEFVKRMGVKHTLNYQVLYLYCSRGGGFRDNTRSEAGDIDGLPKVRRKRPSRGVSKCGKSCTAFLRVLHWPDGRLTAIGCVEHTGHRMGTPYLRIIHQEREIMDDYLYSNGEHVPVFYIVEQIETLHLIDAFTVRERRQEEIQAFQQDPDEIVSLGQLYKKMDESSVFDISLPTHYNGQGFTFGYMNERMKDLWRKYGHRAVCANEERLLLGEWDLRVILILVFDDRDTPKVACAYVTHANDKNPIFKQLHAVTDSVAETFVTDIMPDWHNAYHNAFGDAALNTEIQVAEWHILQEWASALENFVMNRVDRFHIMCALRRWIRTTESNRFEQMTNDLFEAFREMELGEMITYMDQQLTEPEYAKRWTPVGRNPLTDHTNPSLELACRMLRERYLNCELCTRIDEYMGLFVERIDEFNDVVMETLGPIPLNLDAPGVTAPMGLPTGILMYDEDDAFMDEYVESEVVVSTSDHSPPPQPSTSSSVSVTTVSAVDVGEASTSFYKEPKPSKNCPAWAIIRPRKNFQPRVAPHEAFRNPPAHFQPTNRKRRIPTSGGHQMEMIDAADLMDEDDIDEHIEEVVEEVVVDDEIDVVNGGFGSPKIPRLTERHAEDEFYMEHEPSPEKTGRLHGGRSPLGQDVDVVTMSPMKVVNGGGDRHRDEEAIEEEEEVVVDDLGGAASAVTPISPRKSGRIAARKT